LVKTLAVFKFGVVVFEAEVEVLKMKGETVLGWVGTKFLGCYQGPVEDERVGDTQTC
jgi:hypothetical protein